MADYLHTIPTAIITFYGDKMRWSTNPPVFIKFVYLDNFISYKDINFCVILVLNFSLKDKGLKSNLNSLLFFDFQETSLLVFLFYILFKFVVFHEMTLSSIRYERNPELLFACFFKDWGPFFV